MSLMQSMRNFLWGQEDAQKEERYVRIAKASFKQALSYVYIPPSQAEADNPSPERLLSQPVTLLKLTFIELVKEFTKPIYALNAEESRIIATLCDYFELDLTQLHASNEEENDAQAYLQIAIERISAAQDAWDFLPTVEAVLQQVESIPPKFWNRGLLYRTFITVFSFPVFNPTNLRNDVIEQHRNQLEQLKQKIITKNQKITTLENRITTLENVNRNQRRYLLEKNKKIEEYKRLLKNEKNESAELKKSLLTLSEKILGSSSDSEEEGVPTDPENRRPSTPNAQQSTDAPSKNPQRFFSPAYNDAQFNEETARMAFQSQREIHQVKLDRNSSFASESITVEVPPDGNCGFTATHYALQIADSDVYNAHSDFATRPGFITLVQQKVQALRNKLESQDTRERLITLLSDVYAASNCVFNLENEDSHRQWIDTFRHSSQWAQGSHFMLLSFLLNVRFKFYNIDSEHPDYIIPRLSDEIIDQTSGDDPPLEIHLFHNTAGELSTSNNHFDLLYLVDPDNQEALKTRIGECGYRVTQWNDDDEHRRDDSSSIQEGSSGKGKAAIEDLQDPVRTTDVESDTVAPGLGA